MIVLPEIKRDQFGFSRRKGGSVRLWRCPGCGWFCSVCRRKKKCCLQHRGNGGDVTAPTLQQ